MSSSALSSLLAVKLWWASFLLILAHRHPRVSLDCSLFLSHLWYRTCSCYKEMIIKTFRERSVGCGKRTDCEKRGKLGAAWLPEECEKCEVGVAEVLLGLGTTEWETNWLAYSSGLDLQNRYIYIYIEYIHTHACSHICVCVHVYIYIHTDTSVFMSI